MIRIKHLSQFLNGIARDHCLEETQNTCVHIRQGIGAQTQIPHKSEPFPINIGTFSKHSVISGLKQGLELISSWIQTIFSNRNYIFSSRQNLLG